MATNVQGSASSIGMAPAAGMGAAGQGAGPLPSLTAGAASGGATPVDPTAGAGAVQDPAAAAGGAAPAGFDPSKLLSQGRWLGPLMTIGGGIAAAIAMKDPTKVNTFMKWGGISAALSGVGITAMGFKAKGIETGTQATEVQAVAAMQQLQQQYEATMQNLSAQATTEITTLKQQLAQAQAGAAAGQGAGQGTGATGDGTSGSGLGVGPGLDTTVLPNGQGSTAPIGEGSGTGTPVGTTPGTGSTTGTAGTQTGAASPQALVGRTIDLAAGASATGTPIADAGTYKIEQIAGDPNGYATLEEANAATRATMSTELMGSKFIRWMVVEQGGRYYGALAKGVAAGGQPNPLPAELGKVVGWSAMNHVSEGGVDGWQAYEWTQAGGARTIAVPYGATNVFGGSTSGGGPTGTAPTGTAPTGTGPSGVALPGQAGTTGTTGTGQATPFDPATQVGRTFSINASSTAEGDLARGGVVQVQKFIETSAGGFGTAEEAASAARQARQASGGDQWTRWMSMQGSDGRFYVYQGSIVKRPTVELQASPVHVFGMGFAEFFDGSTNAWKAVRDAQAA
jgi:hypothetical protein